MGSHAESKRPHAVCIPYPAQGHISPMLKLAKLIHHRGFYITFVNTEHNHKRLLKSRGLNALDGLPDFKFQAIPDGLPPSEANSTQDIPSLCSSTSENCLAPFCGLLTNLKNDHNVPPVSCVVSGCLMSFALKAAEQFGLPVVVFWTASACGLLGYAQYRRLLQKGYIPLKDESDVRNGYLETKIDWIPGMKDDITLRDLPSFIRTTSSDDILFNFLMTETEKMSESRALLLNTFDDLERDSLDALSAMYPPLYSIGPLSLMLNNIPEDERLETISSNLWKEDSECIEWLNTKEPNSVVYVNFGSIAVMTADQLTEFAWGLANSKKPFLWIVRPDIVAGKTAMLPPEITTETRERGKLVSWCPQEQVLKHPAIGGFLTHSGWNSTLESICGGVPVISWPFYAEQPTNCRYSSVEWGIGMEIHNDVKRDEVEKIVRELMEGEKGQRMRKKAVEWKNKADAAASPGTGSSWRNLDKLFKELLLPS